MEFAANWNFNALIGLGTQRLPSRTKLDTISAVLADNVVRLAIAAFVLSAQIVGLVILGASLNQRKTKLVVIGREVSSLANNAFFSDIVNVIAVRNDSGAVGLVSTDIELVSASLTQKS